MNIQINEFVAELSELTPARSQTIIARWIFEALRRLPVIGFSEREKEIDFHIKMGKGETLHYVAEMPQDVLRVIQWFSNTQAMPTDNLREAKVEFGGKYKLVYYALDTDSDGYPVVPETHRDAVLSYLIWQHWRSLGRVDPTKMEASKMYEQEYYTSAKQLTGSLNINSKHDLHELVYKSKKKQW